jgi:hypothetical protein
MIRDKTHSERIRISYVNWITCSWGHRYYSSIDYLRASIAQFNPLTSELNPSEQRCLTRFLLGILLPEPCISLNIYVPTNTPIIHSVYSSCLVAPICFGIALLSSESVPGDFWEMLNWGAVDRILWMGVLCLVTWCVPTRNASWIWQCNAETCRSYHT